MHERIKYEMECSEYGTERWRCLLERGWEPFAVVIDPYCNNATIVYFRRQVI